MPYKYGEVIGNKFTILEQLGKGGCGVVYKVYSHEMEEEIALKTYYESYSNNPEVRKRFNNEAKNWFDIGFHQNIVDALLIEFIGGRQFIGMELVFSKNGKSETLQDYLSNISLKTSIIWSIQFCDGISYAYSQGIKAHRDIKPHNILISDSDTIKISDFGLASILQDRREILDGSIFGNDGNIGFAGPTQFGSIIGTSGYQSPEQEIDPSQSDVRSDIFSYGIIIFQMISQGIHPLYFPQLNKSKQDMILKSPLFPIFKKCVNHHPDDRYQNFIELKEELERNLSINFGEKYVPIPFKPFKCGDFVNRGNSYAKIGFHSKAFVYFDEALKIDPNLPEAIFGKAISLTELKFFELAKELFDKSVQLYPTNARVWLNRGSFYKKTGQINEALLDFRKSLELDPIDSHSFYNIGAWLLELGKFEEAVPLFEQAFQYDPDLIQALCGKSSCLFLMGNLPEALICFDQILSKDPLNLNTLSLKAQCLFTLGDMKGSYECLEKALAINPNDPLLLFIQHHGFENIDKYTGI
ncbi:protein kinase [Methanospirillum sp. J.3.6.1-F.2.7.3]|uniref:Protein kinase n=1 Tax=Methanospirillum purgamenti TaxID=2834276 RepID=A0A8E7EI50_9EURY|nr:MULTISPECIES: serine/threonine-protein kinase [Methanospirillum]MDX8551202.1 tetratricopeptide repeat protein [Methanospirillum hungatei]QVV87734.1 protein kinase [Methanospirillum sp. J.3.6.1-F.2.7.3]